MKQEIIFFFCNKDGLRITLCISASILVNWLISKLGLTNLNIYYNHSTNKCWQLLYAGNTYHPRMTRAWQCSVQLFLDRVQKHYYSITTQFGFVVSSKEIFQKIAIFAMFFSNTQSQLDNINDCISTIIFNNLF